MDYSVGKLYALELASDFVRLPKLMEDWGMAGGFHGAGLLLPVGLFPAEGVAATSVISTPLCACVLDLCSPTGAREPDKSARSMHVISLHVTTLHLLQLDPRV